MPARRCACRHYGRWRRYTTAPRYRGFAVVRGPDRHWAVQTWRWVFTTSPCADEE